MSEFENPVKDEYVVINTIDNDILNTMKEATNTPDNQKIELHDILNYMYSQGYEYKGTFQLSLIFKKVDK